jgi:hypothetical protein
MGWWKNVQQTFLESQKCFIFWLQVVVKWALTFTKTPQIVQLRSVRITVGNFTFWGERETLGIELRALCLFGRQSTAWAMSLALFVLVILEIGLLFAQCSWTMTSYFTLPTIAGMTGTCHHAQFFYIEMGCQKLFCLDWHGTAILPISVPSS